MSISFFFFCTILYCLCIAIILLFVVVVYYIILFTAFRCQRAKIFILLSFTEAHKIAIKVYSWVNASVQSNSSPSPPRKTQHSPKVTPHDLFLPLSPSLSFSVFEL